jgi:hypothetical protein
LNVHASRSLDTFAAEITEPGATRVLPMSPFGYGHAPDGVAAPATVVVELPEPADPPVLAELLEVSELAEPLELLDPLELVEPLEPPPLHAATSRASEASAVNWAKEGLVRIPVHRLPEI